MPYNKEQHPCYNPETAKTIGRVHLPVAVKCNMQCNYCNRDYSCVNESRPGVCSTILKSSDIKTYMEAVLRKHPEINIVGVAGPAEPLADLEIFKQTYFQLNKYFPQLKTCLATNGLVLADNISLIQEYEIDYITVTINALDPSVIAKIYDWIQYNGKIYKGQDLAEVLREQQINALKALATLDSVTYKVNTVLMPGINEEQILKIAETAAQYDVYGYNIMPYLPVQGSKFAKLDQINHLKLSELRKSASKFIRVLQHCNRCRADAVGVLNSCKS